MLETKTVINGFPMLIGNYKELIFNKTAFTMSDIGASNLIEVPN